jgi:cytochrome c biogenesis factor
LRTSIPSITSLAELNPILQDPVLAIHPPCIYAGYVASAIAFSLCMSTFRLEQITRAGAATTVSPRVHRYRFGRI